MDLEYNYLSEDAKAREILFNVCLLNQNMDSKDQKLFHQSVEKWNLLFE